jgi:hypothetical protein
VQILQIGAIRLAKGQSAAGLCGLFLLRFLQRIVSFGPQMVEFFTVDNKQVAVTSKKLVRLEGCRTPKCEEMVGKEGWGSLCSTLLN